MIIMEISKKDMKVCARNRYAIRRTWIIKSKKRKIADQLVKQIKLKSETVDKKKKRLKESSDYRIKQSELNKLYLLSDTNYSENIKIVKISEEIKNIILRS